VKATLTSAVLAIVLVLSGSPGWALEPYVQLNTGVFSRDVEESDSSLAGGKAFGTADSTRVLATIGMEFGRLVNLYFQGGGADLSIDEYNNYDGSMDWAYGGGMRLTIYQAPYRSGLNLYVEGNYLRYTTDDTVQIQQNCTGLSGCPASPNNFFPRTARETIQWNEYAVLLGASARYMEGRPYGGIRLSKVDATDRVRAAPDSNFSTSFQANLDLKEQDNFGIFLGIDFFLDRAAKTALNLQMSLIDQNSLQVGLRRSF